MGEGRRARRDGLEVLRAAGAMFRAEIDRIKARLRASFLGRLAWVIKNRRVDHAKASAVPDYVFTLTEAQARDVELFMCERDLRFAGMAAFYAKHPRGQFNLPPQSSDPFERAAEGAALAAAAMDTLYPPEITPDGRKLYKAGNPFLRMACREYESQGAPQRVRDI